MIAPNTDYDGEILSFDLPPSLTVADLKAFVNAETNLPQASQHFYLNNVPVQGDTKTLEEVGIKDGDMLAMLTREPGQQNNMGSQRRPQNAQRRPQQGVQPPGSQTPEDIEAQRQSILANPAAMAQVREQRPALADAINDKNRFLEVYNEMIREDEQRREDRLEQMRLLNEDPFNVEAQTRIEEMIRQESVQENLQFAYEHNPEGQSQASCQCYLRNH